MGEFQNAAAIEAARIDQEREEVIREATLLLAGRFDRSQTAEERERELQEMFARLLAKIVERGLCDEDEMEAIRHGLSEASRQNEKDAFVRETLLAIDPIIQLKLTRPKAFEEIQRERFLETGEFIPLNEVLSYGEMEGTVHIHLAPAHTEGMGEKRRLVKEGLQALACIVRDRPDIRGITAISWIVAKQPKLLERLGFVIQGACLDESGKETSDESGRPIWRAVMDREAFLKKYLSEEQA